VRSFQDSREVFWQEVSQNGITQKTAIAGELWMRPEIYTLPFVVPFSQTKKSPEQLAQLGVEHLVVGNLENYEVFDRNFKLVKSFPGDTAVQRIVKNPELRLYAISEEYASLENLQKSVDENASYQVNVSKNKNGNLICTEGHVQHTDAEQHCWTRAKFMKFFTEGRTSLELASAWEGQEVKVFSTERKLLQSLRFQKPWDWKVASLPTGTKAVYLETKILQSPGMGDARMLGVAVR
jgi:hypothetical protein